MDASLLGDLLRARHALELDLASEVRTGRLALVAIIKIEDASIKARISIFMLQDAVRHFLFTFSFKVVHSGGCVHVSAVCLNDSIGEV